jgi:hypothetical protein
MVGKVIGEQQEAGGIVTREGLQVVFRSEAQDWTGAARLLTSRLLSARLADATDSLGNFPHVLHVGPRAAWSTSQRGLGSATDPGLLQLVGEASNRHRVRAHHLDESQVPFHCAALSESVEGHRSLTTFRPLPFPIAIFYLSSFALGTDFPYQNYLSTRAS